MFFSKFKYLEAVRISNFFTYSLIRVYFIRLRKFQGSFPSLRWVLGQKTPKTVIKGNFFLTFAHATDIGSNKPGLMFPKVIRTFQDPT